MTTIKRFFFAVILGGFVTALIFGSIAVIPAIPTSRVPGTDIDWYPISQAVRDSCHIFGYYHWLPLEVYEGLIGLIVFACSFKLSRKVLDMVGG